MENISGVKTGRDDQESVQPSKRASISTELESMLNIEQPAPSSPRPYSHDDDTPAVSGSPICVMDFMKFKGLGRLPSYSNDHNIIVNINQVDREESFFIYISHSWIHTLSSIPDKTEGDTATGTYVSHLIVLIFPGY
jgi:hypothetical protein